MIYFVRRHDGQVKIGTTIHLSTRLKRLSAEFGEGLEVLAVCEGSYGEETGIHRRFSHLRSQGEWFEPGDGLMEFIESERGPWGPSKEPCRLAVKLDRKVAIKARIVATFVKRTAEGEGAE